MTDADARILVRANARALALALDEAQAARVATHLQRTAAMATLLDSFSLAPHDELVELFCPAPFPPANPPSGA